MHASFGFLLLSCLTVGLCDDFQSLGCFKQSSIQSSLSSQGEYLYQSSSYCWSKCPSDKVAALLNGKYCYCGSSVPNSNLMVDDSNCNTPCQGYGQQTCGGNGYFQVYVNGAVEGSSVSSSSDSASSSSSSSSSSKSSSSNAASNTKSSSSKSSTSSTGQDKPSTSSSSADESSQALDPASSSEDPSSDAAASSPPSQASKTEDGVTTVISTVTSSPNGSTNSVIEITTTVGSHTTGGRSPSSSASPDSNDPPNQQKSLSGGKIAGAVVGSVAGVALISGLIFLILHWKRNRSHDDDDDFFDIPGKKANHFDSVAPNGFIGGAAGAGVVGAHAHHSSNTTRSYSTNNDDGFFYDNHPADMNHDAYPGEEEYGRRRLSNGSLPDMVTRNPGSLKVVN